MKRTIVIAVIMLLFGGCATRPDIVSTVPDNELPKYGDAKYQTIWSRTPAGDRERLTQSSSDASKRGWSMLREGDLSTALKRFNQSWSLNPQNANALWGMAIVQFERTKRDSGSSPTRADLARMDQAVLLVEEAAALPSPEASLLDDGAVIVMTRGGMRKYLGVDGSSQDFDRAETLLRGAEAMEVRPLIYENWAGLERYRGRPEAAERYAEKARRLRGGSAGG